jgi:hypothetical protein
MKDLKLVKSIYYKTKEVYRVIHVKLDKVVIYCTGLFQFEFSKNLFS